MIWVLQHGGNLSFAFSGDVRDFSDLINKYEVKKIPEIDLMHELCLERVFEKLNLDYNLLRKYGMYSLSVNDVVIYYDKAKKCYRAFKVEPVGFKELEFVRCTL